MRAAAALAASSGVQARGMPGDTGYVVAQRGKV